MSVVTIPERGQSRPGLAVWAVLLGAFIVGFQVRLFGIGQADLRAGLGLGVDEAAWINTIGTAPQMLVAPCVPWLATTFGIRRILVVPGLVYAVVSFAIPHTHDYNVLAALSLVHGLLLGIFVPATLLVTMRSMPQRWWLVGIALYALRPGLTANAGIWLVDFYVQHFGWQYFYWQDTFLAPFMAAAAFFATPSVRIDKSEIKKADWSGMLLLGSSLTLVFIALDQGNRLDWLESGTILSCLAGGGVLFVAFILNEAIVQQPWASIASLASRNSATILLIATLYLMTALSNTTLIPTYLTTVAGLRPEQIGLQLMLWCCAPLLLMTPLVVWALYLIDGRIVLSVGLCCFAAAAIVGTNLTSEWNGETFRTLTILQGAGHILTFLPVIALALANTTPQRAPALAAYIQVIRLLGGESGQAMIATFLRKREQLHSFLVGLNVQQASPIAATRLNGATSDLLSAGSGEAHQRAIAALAQEIWKQATVLSIIDGFWLSFIAAALALCALVFVSRAPRGPLAPS